MDTEDKDQLVGLFTDVDYKELTFEYKDYKQTIFALKTSSTDYDLTGQIIWKAADILSKFILDKLGNETLQGKTVLELGSGPGLCGLISQHYASKVILSDYQDLVMDLIKINIRDSRPKNDKCHLLCTKLDWCKVSEEGFYDNLEVQDSESQVVEKLGDVKFNYVIGSDIVYWTSSIKPLMNVLNILFERNQGLVFFICYIERAVATHKDLLAQFKENNFKVEEIGEDISKPIDSNSYIYRVTK